MDKGSLRKEIINKRNDLSLELKMKYDELIFEKLIDSEIYKNAKDIFIYVSFGSEVDTKNIIEYSLKNNKNIYVPKTYKGIKEMVAVKINSLNNMDVDKWGILEPKDVDKDKVSEKFDLIIMPGVVFDKKGNRIGYGGGYYDKYISNLKFKCNKIALSYDLQMINNIKTEKHDIKPNYIITNKEFIRVKEL